MYKIIKNKRAQEEIVGFAVIVIIVSIILLFFLVFSLSSDDGGGESYRASSFLGSALSYTTGCEENRGFIAVDELIVSCYDNGDCEGEGEIEDSCMVLNETLNELLESSWPVGPESKTKGYKMEAVSGEETIFSISKGNVTGTYKGAQQILPESGAQIKVFFTAYS